MLSLDCWCLIKNTINNGNVCQNMNLFNSINYMMIINSIRFFGIALGSCRWGKVFPLKTEGLFTFLILLIVWIQRFFKSIILITCTTSHFSFIWLTFYPIFYLGKSVSSFCFSSLLYFNSVERNINSHEGRVRFFNSHSILFSSGIKYLSLLEEMISLLKKRNSKIFWCFAEFHMICLASSQPF